MNYRPRKTKITHINAGFDFLGFNVRKYEDKLLIKPGARQIRAILTTIRTVIKENKTAPTEALIRQLNPKVRGWSNYYRHVVSSRAFNRIDSLVFTALWKWCVRRHPKKRRTWIRRKYFKTHKSDNLVFTAVRDSGEPLTLTKAQKIPIVRHIKIKAAANPYDPNYSSYFYWRSKKRTAGSSQDGFQKA